MGKNQVQPSINGWLFVAGGAKRLLRKINGIHSIVLGR
jgi:hypothetical protein